MVVDSAAVSVQMPSGSIWRTAAQKSHLLGTARNSVFYLADMAPIEIDGHDLHGYVLIPR